MTLKIDAKFEEKLTCGLENDMRDLFVQSRQCMSLKLTEELYVMTMKNDTKIEEGLTFVLKLIWRISRILTGALESLKHLCFSWLFYIMFDLKKYRGVIFHETEEWCKIWRKTHLKVFKCSPEHFKMSKLGLWWDPLVQSGKGMTLKFTEELRVMTMKNNAKLEEEYTCHFKTEMRNLTNADSSTQKSKKFAF